MIIKCYKEKHNWLLFMDIEFDHQVLVQFAGALFKRIDEETYQLAASINQYVSTSIGIYFQDYTDISQDFVLSNGVQIESLRDLIFGELLKGVDMKDLEVISHGLKNDRLVLKDNGIDLNTYETEGKVKPVAGYCTFNNAKRILKRERNLKLENLAEEAGYYLNQAHNAYNDLWATVSVFTFLKKMEYQNERMLQDEQETKEKQNANIFR